MFIEERHEKILQMLKDKKRVEVQELSELFEVSEDTIRRDLRIMEQKGKVHRTYGGAILPDKVNSYENFIVRENIQNDVKQSIASLAQSFIQERDTLLLDGSTTVAKIVPLLSGYKNLTVITNSITIAYDILHQCPNINLHIIGGIVRNDIGNSISIESLKDIEKLYVDKVFLSACSISLKGELTTPIIEDAHVKKAMLNAGREVYILADSSKFGQKSLMEFGKIKPEYTIISDSDLPEDINEDLQALISRGLKILTT
ncbi:DeoR/GlpR family DNA-binding transcription regulator [Clostridium intestinale]|uniref:DeoR family transcriptional regulator n=2 Tax=Clostridium intestinale TaxID=36845 RepID=U2NSJ0_9CLOT|nr:DeoR/GlpR family DNA-binding transcription regulator [Clostridium intestinale]ERK31836.1 DeoR family transcriptional regulator [Clostridium intestinale URNW]QLY78884.1 DeoR/GlpR transcriptional regulator [Clostridium intestinale]